MQIERADSVVAFDGTADIVVANIIADTIISMADDLRAKSETRRETDSLGDYYGAIFRSQEAN